MKFVWIALAVIAGIVMFGWLLAIVMHKVIDWRENRWPKPDSWQTTTGSMFAIREDEPRPVTDLGSFFADQDQPAEDPWNGVESWSVDHGFRAEDKLDVIKAFARVGYDEVPTPAPAPIDEPEPAMLFDGLTAEYKQVNPNVAGHTTSWVKLSAEDDAAIRDVYKTWNGFATTEPEADAKPRRRAAAARKPAES